MAKVNLSKEQLVDLFSGAFYGCDFFAVKTLQSEQHLDEQYTQEYLSQRTIEDKLADRVMNGGHFIVIDLYDNHKEYKVSFKKIINQLSKVPFHKEQYLVRNYCNFMTERADYFDYNNLMQFIVFGKVIYG